MISIGGLQSAWDTCRYPRLGATVWGATVWGAAVGATDLGGLQVLTCWWLRLGGLGPAWALVGRALVGPSGPLWAGPLKARWALVGRFCVGSPGRLLARPLGTSTSGATAYSMGGYSLGPCSLCGYSRRDRLRRLASTHCRKKIIEDPSKYPAFGQLICVMLGLILVFRMPRPG